jgi:hypothetical protein
MPSKNGWMCASNGKAFACIRSSIQSPVKILIKNNDWAHTYNPSYKESRDLEDHGLMIAQRGR